MLGSGQGKVFAQNFQQRFVRRKSNLRRFAVERE
jgi:hypothetical protein